VNGPPQNGAYGLFIGLNLAESLGLDQRGPYWRDPLTFERLVRIAQLAMGAPAWPAVQFAHNHGIDIAPRAQLEKEFANKVAPYLDEILAPSAEDSPRHSHAIVAVDREGNVAVVTHSINTLIWGDTGIIVDGVPIPDSAGFKRSVLSRMRPGDRVPHDIVDTIVLRGNAPILATASIGSSLLPESIRVLVSVLDQHQDLSTVLAEPPLLANFSHPASTAQRPVLVPAGAYESDFLKEGQRLGLNIEEVPQRTANNERGTLAVVEINPKTGQRTGINIPGVMIFNFRD
jgi:gamma-glutamyltranspeptidase/glutathione hydrolase